jgi:enamine deaminase RidA (YjgF/YER057c/UK114 family)
VSHGDLERQTVQILENIKPLVKAAGGRWPTWRGSSCTSPAGISPTVLAVRRRYFRAPYPAPTTVGGGGRAHQDWLVEIEARAVLP